MKILITGGAGYLGSVMTRNLLKNHEVIVYDNLMYNQTSLVDLSSNPNFTFHYGDVRDWNKLRYLVEQVDVIIPLAALVGFPLCEKDKELATKYLTKKSRMDDKIQTMFKVRAYKHDLDKLGQSLVEGKTRHSQLTSNLQYLNEREENIQNQINSIVSEMDRYVAQEQDVVFNQSIDLRIQDLKSEQYLLDDKLEDTKLASTSIFGNIQVLKNKETQINESIDKVEQLEGDYQAYQYLLNAIQRDGVPYDLITKSLPTVEGAVNDILAQVVDFSIVFTMNGKDIDTHIVYDDDRIWSLELSSGMERFISSLAIRIGLMNVSNLPQGNFLAIDEGWGTMDSDNLNSVAQLFQYLKSQFQFTFVVSHIETMRDFVDTLLEIKKVDGSSSVRFSR